MTANVISAADTTTIARKNPAVMMPSSRPLSRSLSTTGHVAAVTFRCFASAAGVVSAATSTIFGSPSSLSAGAVDSPNGS